MTGKPRHVQACERAQNRTRYSALLCGCRRLEWAGVPRLHLQWQLRGASSDHSTGLRSRVLHSPARVHRTRHRPDDNRNRPWIWGATQKCTKQLHGPDYTGWRATDRQASIWVSKGTRRQIAPTQKAITGGVSPDQCDSGRLCVNCHIMLGLIDVACDRCDSRGVFLPRLGPSEMAGFFTRAKAMISRAKLAA
jgi:hypothetical protein